MGAVKTRVSDSKKIDWQDVSTPCLAQHSMAAGCGRARKGLITGLRQEGIDAPKSHADLKAGLDAPLLC